MDQRARRPGPPVDAARLQPDNQGDIQDVDEGLVGAWLDDPELAVELADELERLRRLQADEELLLALQLEQFTGLAGEGHHVLTDDDMQALDRRARSGRRHRLGSAATSIFVMNRVQTVRVSRKICHFGKGSRSCDFNC